MNLPSSPITRRKFVHSTIVGGLTAYASQGLAAEPEAGIPRRVLGRTGAKVSLLGLGGYHIGTQFLESESIKLIRMAIDQGVNFLDNCWDYNEGRSEERMGKALRDGYRDKVFLMSKIDGQTKESAARQIDESLRRLQTDHVDLMQFHEVIRPGDPERIFAEGGSAEAMLAAKKAGKVRFIGFTGHKSPEIHLKMLATGQAHDFRFDAVQMPLNVMDAHFDSFEQKVLPVLLKEEIGVLGMKSMGGGQILRSKAVTAVECLQYALSLPVSVVIAGCESEKILDQALTTARGFKPFDAAARAALLAKSAEAAAAGKFEIYKVSSGFDGTARHPEWLG